MQAGYASYSSSAQRVGVMGSLSWLPGFFVSRALAGKSLSQTA
jgi:hypothetical protein